MIRGKSDTAVSTTRRASFFSRIRRRLVFELRTQRTRALLGVEDVSRGPEYVEFCRRFEVVRNAILDGLDAPQRAACEAAFSEPEACYVLYRWIRSNHPRVVVETGSFLGLSALVCGIALRENFAETGISGHLYSISVNSFYRVSRPLERAARTAHRLNLNDYVTFLEGSSTPLSGMDSSDPEVHRERVAYMQALERQGRESLLNKIARAVGSLDLVYLDGLHYEAFVMTEISAVIGHLSSQGAIFVDDVFLSGSRRKAFGELLLSLSRFCIDTYSLRDYLRLRLHYYNLPWIVDAFRSTRVARASAIRVDGKLLRTLKIVRNPAYSTNYGQFSSWYTHHDLESLVDTYEVVQRRDGFVA